MHVANVGASPCAHYGGDTVFPFVARASTIDDAGAADEPLVLVCQATFPRFSRLRFDLVRKLGPAVIYQQGFPKKVLLGALSPAQEKDRAQQLSVWLNWAISNPDINAAPEFQDFFLEAAVVHQAPGAAPQDVLVVAELVEKILACATEPSLATLHGELKHSVALCALPLATFLRLTYAEKGRQNQQRVRGLLISLACQHVRPI